MMKLYEFPHSPYVEKVRWALDYKGLPFERISLMPGLHIFTIKQIASNSTVPVLVNGEDVVQDSSKILSYLDQKFPYKNLTPVDENILKTGLEIEATSDIRLGTNLRRVLYYWLFDEPGVIEYFFSHRWGLPKKILFRAAYPSLKKKISEKYQITKDNFETSFIDLDKYLNELGHALGNKNFLLSDDLTRTDLAVASMLSLLAQPKEYPIPEWPKGIRNGAARDFIKTNSKKDIVRWTKELYREWRLPSRVGL